MQAALVGHPDRHFAAGSPSPVGPGPTPSDPTREGHRTVVGPTLRRPSGPESAAPGRLPEPGSLIHQTYLLGSKIGAGGMGAVFEAVHLRLERQVAVKIIEPGLDAMAAVRATFREARLASRIEHPGVVKVYDCDVDPASHRPFLVMERFGVATERPEAGGSPAELASLVGTPSFMSPEQAMLGDVDHRSDLFALGCLLHGLLTGKPPFESRARLHELLAGRGLDVPTLRPVVDDEPACVGSAILRGRVHRLHDWLLQPDPADRPPSARAVLDAIRAM